MLPVALHTHAITLWCHHEIPSCIWTRFTLVKFNIYPLLGCKTTCEPFDLQFILAILDSSILHSHIHWQGCSVPSLPGVGDLREWSISPNLISCTPPCNNATVCSPHKPRALPPPAHMWDAVLLSCPPTAGASPSRPPHPSALPPFNLNNASVLSATLCRLFSEDKQERETDRGCREQWNSWLCWSSSFSIAFLHLLCHARANVHFDLWGNI